MCCKGFIRRDKSPGHFGHHEGDGRLIQDGLEGEVEAVLESALDTEREVAGGLQVTLELDGLGVEYPAVVVGLYQSRQEL